MPKPVQAQLPGQSNNYRDTEREVWHLNRQAVGGKPDDAGHSPAEALLRELGQDDCQEGTLVAAQHVMRHAVICGSHMTHQH